MADSFALGLIGAGNMAEGIVAAVVASGLYPPSAMAVADPVAERRELFARHYGTAVAADNRELVRRSRRVLLAVKPQSFGEVAGGIADAARPDQLFISIMAGISTGKIASSLSGVPARVVRVMPNLPIRVGAGMAGVFAGAHATAADLADTRAIFDAGGSTVVIEDEGLLDAVTAMSGSGPAYFYYFVESLVAGGVACGLTEADALKLAEYTCLGAARMMLATGEDPAELRRKVTSKGGTTQAALEHMAGNGVGEALRDAVLKAFERGRELGR